MIKKRNKIMILFVALMMFTFTWAGVFADTEPQEGNSEDNPPVVEENDENLDGEVLNNEAGETEKAEEPAVTDETKDGAAAKAGGDAQPISNVKAEVLGNKITVSWDAIGEGSVTYKVTEFVNGAEKESVNVENDTSYPFENRAVGKYKYKVTAEVEGVKYESESKEVEVLPATPAKINTIRALSGDDCVVLKWEYAGKADGFIIYRYNSESDFNSNVNGKRINPNGSSYLENAGNTWTWTNSIDVAKTQTYWYKVCAVNKKGNDFNAGNVVESEPAVIMDKGCVRPMYITLKLKKKRTLKSLNGGPRITLKKNTTITANGFGGGCYYFTYNGKKYRMARSSAKKQKALYNGRYGYNYTPEEAELFVSQVGLKSKTNYLIWVSFYTQRLYLFQKNGGDWKCIRDWDCATGKASTPSPTGDKAIGKKKKSHHNIKWWCSFSNPKSIANSIHGKKKGWKLGLPQSHGCIRNEVANAKYIYTTCPKNTKVYNY